jgi:hypothetical protein
MRIEALINTESCCIAGISTSGYVGAHLNHESPPGSASLSLVAIETHESESVHFEWPPVALKEGDVVTIRLLADGPFTEPAKKAATSDHPANLFADPRLAADVLVASKEFENRLSAILEKSKALESPEDHAKFVRAVGRIAAELGERLLYPIYRRHSALIPDELRGDFL